MALLGFTGRWGTDVIQPCQEKASQGVGERQQINISWICREKGCPFLSLPLPAHTFSPLKQHTEQIRLFHVGGSVECAGICALVPVRNPKVPLLCPIASISNAEDDIYNTALRGKCSWCWFRFASFSPTCSRNIYPSVMLWVWVCGSISHQKCSPDCSFYLYFQRSALLSPAVKNWFATRVISGASLRILFLSY